MTVYAVIDTNVIVSSLLTSNPDSPTVGVIKAIRDGRLIPLYSDYLISEYRDVLSRSKFAIPDVISRGIMSLFTRYGIQVETTDINIEMPDEDDVPIFLITMETRNWNSYPVVGNIKHYPPMDFIVTPKKMMSILEEKQND